MSDTQVSFLVTELVLPINLHLYELVEHNLSRSVLKFIVMKRQEAEGKKEESF